MPSLRTRQRHDEWMDHLDVPPQALRRSLKFIHYINTALGYTHATLAHLNQFSKSWKPHQRITILDIATGSADIPRAILRWADRRHFDIHIVAVDLHPLTAHIAASHSPDPRLHIVQADALDLPFADQSFDYVLTAMFLHHLDEPAVLAVLRSMHRLSRRGIIIADLLRHRRAYFWISLFTLFADPMLKHDARVSVAQAFTKPEILSFRTRAALHYTHYTPHFGHRFILAGEHTPL